MSKPSSTSSNESFVVVSSETQDDDGNSVTQLFKPMVTFENVHNVYPDSLDVIVEISYDATYRKTTDDKVVLLPVAWSSFDQVICVGEVNGNYVKFHKTDLPEHEDTYQMCYCFEQENSVMGISKSFQIRKMSAEEIVDFIDQKEYALLVNKYDIQSIESGQATIPSTSADTVLRLDIPVNVLANTRVESEENTSTIQQQPVDQNARVEDNQELVNKITEEVMKKLQIEWKSKEETLLQEINSLKVIVGEYKKVKTADTDSDSDSSECSDSTLNTRKAIPTPVIYGITPTHARYEQKAVLIRLSHTLRLVPSFHWIVVEDADSQSPLVSDILTKSGISFTHLAVASPLSERTILQDSEFVLQRNLAMNWLRRNEDASGIVYFLDDYKVYSLEIFDEMRSIKKVGVWPVGLAGGLAAEKPIVAAGTKIVVGWNSRWRTDRRFPIDATGCAINLQHLIAHPKALFSLRVEPALRLSAFLSSLVTVEELEPKADGCTKIYVWHLRVDPPSVN